MMWTAKTNCIVQTSPCHAGRQLRPWNLLGWKQPEKTGCLQSLKPIFQGVCPSGWPYDWTEFKETRAKDIGYSYSPTTVKCENHAACSYNWNLESKSAVNTKSRWHQKTCAFWSLHERRNDKALHSYQTTKQKNKVMVQRRFWTLLLYNINIPNKKSRICYKGFMVTDVHEFNLCTNHPLLVACLVHHKLQWPDPVWSQRKRGLYRNGANEAKLKLLIDAWNYQISLVSLYKWCFFSILGW